MSGWSHKRLAELCSIEIGRTPARDNPRYWDTDKQTDNVWVSISDMGKAVSASIHESKEHLSDAGAAITPLVPKGALLLSFKLSLGKLAFAGRPLRTNEAIAALIPNDVRQINKKFLYWYFQSFDWAAAARGSEKIKGATLNKAKLKEIRVPVPSLHEQKRIVAILDEAFEGIDAAVANAEKNLANARELFERCMSSALDRQSDTGSRSARELAASVRGSIRTGPFGSQLLHGEFVDAGIAVLGIDNVVENRFTWNRRRYITAEKYADLRRYTVKPGDVLISIMGTCGRCAVVPNDIELAINSKHLCCITLDRTKCIPEYLHVYFLFHPVARSYLSSQSKGSIMDGLNMGIIQEMPVLIPPLAQQKTIAKLFERVSGASNRLADIQAAKIALLGDLRQAILGKAFAGELTAQPEKVLLEAAE